MDKVYNDTAKILKVLSDPKRLRIVDMLSCGELCACELLEAFHITQPTLSHDMKQLVNLKLVKFRREGKNVYYWLNQSTLNNLQKTLDIMFSDKPDCICHKILNTGREADSNCDCCCDDESESDCGRESDRDCSCGTK